MQFEQGDFRIIIFATVDDDCGAAAKPSATVRVFGQVPGRNKLKAGSRLLVSPSPEIKGADASDEISWFGVGARTV
jgi:hypothetical protein